MAALALIYSFIWYAMLFMLIAGIGLIIVRSIFDYADVNPFTWRMRNVRRATEPVLLPARAILRGFRLDPTAAPFIVVVLFIIVWYLVIQTANTALNTVAGVLYALSSHRPNMGTGIVGYVLFGLLGLYTLAIFVRIIFAWTGASYASRSMRFVVRLTEPLLGPLRRIVPRVGMFDISPLVAFFIVWVLQSAVAATLVRDWPIRFF